MANPKLTREQVLETVANILQDTEYNLSRAKVPAKKRKCQNSLDFWRSVQHHIQNPDKADQK